MKASASAAPARGLNENFTVRKISYGEGVERVFPLYSPMIDSITVVRRGKVRRAKLYYLRGLRGKSARIVERQDAATAEPAAKGKSGENNSNPPRRHYIARTGGPEFREMAKPRTLYDKIWDDHLIEEEPDGAALIYIDRHIVHEVTSPQAFEGLRLSGRKVRAPDKTLLVVDHNVPTTDRHLPNPDPESATQIAYLAENAKFFNLEYYDEFDKRQGIVHIIGPEQGFTLPGVTLVCGDSHTATNGAFGALAYGIGTSEVEHVLATQTLVQKKSKNMRAVVDGKLPAGVTAKDIILAIIGEIGTAGGTGYALEYAGEAIRALSMEGRMTVCNMSVEAGAKAGFIAPDEKTYAYLNGRPKAPKGKDWDAAHALLGDAAAPTTAPISTARSGSTRRNCRRSSPGAPAPSR